MIKEHPCAWEASETSENALSEHYSYYTTPSPPNLSQSSASKSNFQLFSFTELRLVDVGGRLSGAGVVWGLDRTF